MVAAKLGQTPLYAPDVEAAASFYDEWVARNGLEFAPIRAKVRPLAVEINFFVEDVEEVYHAAIEAGATAWFPPAPRSRGDRSCPTCATPRDSSSRSPRSRRSRRANLATMRRFSVARATAAT